ncbi:MAG: sel1 repeat family protein [Alistipes sp.]|nr:sel1 repeat family protein [Alistipes sp.]
MKDFKERRPFIEQGEGNIGIHDINQDSHDTINNHTENHTIVYNGEAGREKLVEERKDEYRLFCKRVITSQFIDRELGRRLRDKALSLSLDEATASEIENYVKSSLSSGVLSPQDLITIDFTKDSIKQNRAGSMKGKILALSERSDNPEVQYYANMILAADDPRSCIARYERSSFDSYWQMFWVYISYLRQRNRENAEKVMNKLNDNPTMSNADLSNLLSGAGFMVEYFANNGDESYRDMAFNYLKLYSGGGEPLVESFVESLKILIKQNRPLYFSQNAELNFYFKMFGAKERQMAAPFAQSIAQTATAVPAQRNAAVTSTTATSSSSGNRTTGGSFSLKKLVYIAAGICVLIWFISRISISTDKSDKNAVPTAVVAENNQTAESSTPTADKSTAAIAQKSQPASSAAANTTSTHKQSSTSAASSGSTVQKPAASTPAANQKTTSSTATTTTPAPAKTTTPTAATPATTPAATQPAAPAELSASELLAKGKSALKKFKAEQAASYFQQAAGKGSIEANYHLGELYYNGNGVAKSFPTAKRYFEAAANAGMADAQYMMGVMARNGQGMDKDFNVARQWLQRAAAQGHKRAEQMLK